MRPDDLEEDEKSALRLRSLLKSSSPAVDARFAVGGSSDPQRDLRRILSGALFGIGVMAFFVSIILVSMASSSYDRAAVTRHWERVPAIVVSSRVVKEESRPMNNDRPGRIIPLPDAPPLYHPEVHYQVTTNDLPYVADVISFPAPLFTREAAAAEFVSHYRQGQKVDAFKDPSSTQTCLLPGFQSTEKKQETALTCWFLFNFALFLFAYILFPEKNKLFKRS